jgi:arylsulfatase A-like enzyme
MNIRKSLLFTSGIGALMPAQAQAAKPMKEEMPNILFILADDLGYGDLGCYGNKVIRTPVIDGLAAQGMRFTDCYAGASVSSPSRCCLMTGLNTGHSRIRGNTCKVGGLQGEREGIVGLVRRTNLQPEDITIADLLHDQGYRTCLVNKWHLDGFDSTATPLDRGFDEFYGWLIREPRSHNYYPSVRWRNRESYIIEPNQSGMHGDHNTDRATDEALSFLERVSKGATPEGCAEATAKACCPTKQPFFLYLAYNVPHVPLDAKDRTAYENSGLPLNDQSYAALITHMDENIGRVLRKLEELGIDDNTIVVFASDNGGASAAEVKELKLNGKLRGWKGELYEGGIRVPMMVRWPDHIKPGGSSSQPCYFPDFMPTFLRIAGVTDLQQAVSTSMLLKRNPKLQTSNPKPARIDSSRISTTNQPVTDGIDLMPAFQGKKLPKRFLYWEQFPRKGLSQAVRYGDWKAVRMSLDKPWELYNLKKDPSETTDVAVQNPKVLALINTWVAAARTESDCWPVEGTAK